MKEFRRSLVKWSGILKTSIGILALLLILQSCKKVEGYGGSSSITGRVYLKELNLANQVINEYYVPEERVYLVFGDDNYFGDDIRTGYDGTFRFDYLYKGNYTIYAYSNCDTCASGTEPVMVNVEITKNNEEIILPDLVIYKK